MGSLKLFSEVVGNGAKVVVAFLLLGLVTSFWGSTALARSRQNNFWLEGLAFPQERVTSRDEGDEPTPWIISWIGAGDLTQYTISNTGQSGYFEPPPDWSGYDGTFPDSFTYGNGYCAEYPSGIGQYYNWAAGIWVGAPYPEVLGNDTTWTPRVSTGAFYSDMGAMSKLHQSNEVFPEGDPHSGEFKYVQPGCGPQPWQELWPYADTSLNSRRAPDQQLDPDSGHIVSDEDTWVVMGDWIPEDSASTIFVMGYDTDGLGVRLEQRTYSWHSFGHNQYIYFSYKIKNMNPFPLDSVYVGYFMDNDIGQAGFEDPEGGNDDLVGYNRALNLGYTYDSNGSEPDWKYPAGYIGSMFCKTPRDIGMTGFQTWTREGQENMVDNTGRDDLKYAELVGINVPNDTDPYHQFETFIIPRDVRQLMASGPFRLEPGEETEVTVAVVAGITFEDIIANADSALAQYNRGYVFTPYIDNDAPIVYSASVDPVCTIPGDTVNISAYVKDASPIQSVMATIESPYGVFVDSVVLSPRKGETYGGSWTTTPGIERHYNINITAVDSLNNSKVYENFAEFTTRGCTKTVSGTVGLADNPSDSSGSEVCIGSRCDSTDIHGDYSISEVTVGDHVIVEKRAGPSSAIVEFEELGPLYWRSLFNLGYSYRIEFTSESDFQVCNYTTQHILPYNYRARTHEGAGGGYGFCVLGWRGYPDAAYPSFPGYSDSTRVYFDGMYLIIHNDTIPGADQPSPMSGDLFAVTAYPSAAYDIIATHSDYYPDTITVTISSNTTVNFSLVKIVYDVGVEVISCPDTVYRNQSDSLCVDIFNNGNFTAESIYVNGWVVMVPDTAETTFTISSLDAGKTFHFRYPFFYTDTLSRQCMAYMVVDLMGDSHPENDSVSCSFYYDEVPIRLMGSQIPQAYSLAQNYPNPFNPATEIRYALPKDCKVKLTIYNVLGEKVATLVDGKQKAGYKTARWNAGFLSSGIYFYRLQAGDFVETRRMILLK